MSSVSQRHRSQSRRRRRHNESLGSPILKFFSPKKCVKTSKDSSPGNCSNKTKVTSSISASSSTSNGQNQKKEPYANSNISRHPQDSLISTSRVRLGEKKEGMTPILGLEVVAKEHNSHTPKNSQLSQNILDLTQDSDGTCNSTEETITPKIGIMRISQIETKELSPKVFVRQLMEPTDKDNIVPVLTDSIIGRDADTPGQRSKETKEKKLPLHIPKTLNGISRHHLTALEIRPSQKSFNNSDDSNAFSLNDLQSSCPTIVWQVNPKAANAIRIHKFRYSHHVNQITRKPIYLKPKFKIELKVGDVIELDWYLFQTNVNDALMRRAQGKKNSHKSMTEHRQLYRVIPIDVSQTTTCGLSKYQLETELFFTPTESNDQKENIDKPKKVPFDTISDNIGSPYIQSVVRKHTPDCGVRSTDIMETEDSQQSRIDILKLSPILKEESTSNPQQSSFDKLEMTTRTHGAIQGMITDESSNSSGEDYESKPMPSVGDRCRALFDVVDRFSSIRKRQKLTSPEGWYFGTVSSIDTPNILVKFDDTEEATFNWRSSHDRKGLELIKCSDNPTKWEGVTSKLLAYETEPKLLYVGDWLNIFNSLKTSYYRGRVAAVHYNEEEKPSHVDVYYDSCEKYECKIPLDKGLIHLVERGFENFNKTNHWMIGLPIQSKGGNNGRTRNRRGNVSSLLPVEYSEDGIEPINADVCKDANNIICEISFPRKVVETWPYETVVQELFQNMKVQCEKNGNCIDWTDEQFHREDPPLLAEDNFGTKETKTDIDSDCSTQNDEESSKHKLQTIHPSLGNSLFRSLNSAEPHIGFGMFMQLANRNYVPNSECFNRVLDVVCNGPTSQGQQFRDANRTHLASIYTNYLLENCVDSSSEHKALRQIEWDKVQNILMLPITRTRKKITSIKSLSAGLQMSSRALEHLSILLSQQLNNLTRNNFATKVKDWKKEKPKLIQSLLHQVTASELLKFAIQCNVKCWLRHGHWVIGFHRFRANRKKPTKAPTDYSKRYDHSAISYQTNRCTKFLGIIINRLTMLYCEEESIELHDQNCCDIIWTTYSNTMASNDEIGIVDEKLSEDYYNKIKIRFILSCFDAQNMNLLRSKLGKAFEVSKDLDIICGNLTR